MSRELELYAVETTSPHMHCICISVHIVESWCKGSLIIYVHIEGWTTRLVHKSCMQNLLMPFTYYTRPINYYYAHGLQWHGR